MYSKKHITVAELSWTYIYIYTVVFFCLQKGKATFILLKVHIQNKEKYQDGCDG